MERSVDGEPAVVYKFTPKYVLKSGTYVTVSFPYVNLSCSRSFQVKFLINVHMFLLAFKNISRNE